MLTSVSVSSLSSNRTAGRPGTKPIPFVARPSSCSTSISWALPASWFKCIYAPLSVFGQLVYSICLITWALAGPSGLDQVPLGRNPDHYYHPRFFSKGPDPEPISRLRTRPSNISRPPTATQRVDHSGLQLNAWSIHGSDSANGTSSSAIGSFGSREFRWSSAAILTTLSITRWFDCCTGCYMS